jgi:CMP-N,N'-diacetyllegionaminic acid synthase
MSRVLGIVPARGGSRGVPGKNIKLLGGRPLLAYTVDVARVSGVVDRLILSTDAEDIAHVGRTLGVEVPFMRPAALGRDDSPMLPVVRHAIDTLGEGGWDPEVVVVLQPTSPLRRPEHIRNAVEMLRVTNADSVVTVVELPRHISPDYLMRIHDGRLVPFLAEGARITRRQDARPAFVRDGTVYACWSRTICEQNSLYGADCRPLIVPASESLSIDSDVDWKEAERRICDVPAVRG